LLFGLLGVVLVEVIDVAAGGGYGFFFLGGRDFLSFSKGKVPTFSPLTAIGQLRMSRSGSSYWQEDRPDRL